MLVVEVFTLDSHFDVNFDVPAIIVGPFRSNKAALKFAQGLDQTLFFAQISERVKPEDFEKVAEKMIKEGIL